MVSAGSIHAFSGQHCYTNTAKPIGPNTLHPVWRDAWRNADLQHYSVETSCGVRHSNQCHADVREVANASNAIVRARPRRAGESGPLNSFSRLSFCSFSKSPRRGAERTSPPRVHPPSAGASQSGAKGAPKAEEQGEGAMGDGVANACANRMHTGHRSDD